MSDELHIRTLLHDIRNEVAVTHNRITLANMDGEIRDELCDELKGYLDQILAKCSQLGEAVHSELKQSEQVSFDKFLQLISSAIQKHAEDALITHDKITDSHVTVIEDDVCLVVEELVRNSQKYGARNIHVHIKDYGDLGLVKVYLRDDGKGISETRRHQLGVGAKHQGVRIVQQLMFGMNGCARWHSAGRHTLVVLSFETSKNTKTMPTISK